VTCALVGARDAGAGAPDIEGVRRGATIFAIPLTAMATTQMMTNTAGRFRWNGT
jgi:hypothetical protein